MAVTPPTAAVGGKVKASDINTLASVVPLVGTYVPTIGNWNSATTSPTTTGRYWITGNICNVIVQSKLGSGAVTVGAITVSLPFTADVTGLIAQSTLFNGAASMSDVSAGASGFYGGFVRYSDANTVAVLRPSAATVGVWATTTASLPFVWATLDEMNVSFSYPLA